MKISWVDFLKLILDLSFIYISWVWCFAARGTHPNLGTGLIGGCELPRRLWELNPGPGMWSSRVRDTLCYRLRSPWVQVTSWERGNKAVETTTSSWAGPLWGVACQFYRRPWLQISELSAWLIDCHVLSIQCYLSWYPDVKAVTMGL